MSNILVVTEISNGQVRSVNHGVFTAARQLGASTGQKVVALLVGGSLAGLEAEPARFGISDVVTVENALLEKFSPDCYAAAVADAVRQTEAGTVLMAATFMGKDLMARVAMLLNTALAQDCVALRQEGDQIVFTRPIYAGKVLAEVTISGTPVMATLRPKSVKPEEAPVSAAVRTLTVDLPQPLAIVEEVQTSATGKLDVTEADIIVSGGRGLRGPENWHLLEELAEALGAATGCSRPVSDEGWRPHEEHIGQTGKTVSPTLYVACGISGAIQHLAGISSSKYILAINKDPEAPIFKVADYGIVGDLFEVLPALTAAVKSAQAGT